MDIPILKDITIIFFVSTISLLICSKLKVPGILGYLLTGLLVGPNGLGLVAHVENVNSMAEIGVVLLLFTIGLEFSLQQLIALKRSAIGGGMLQIIMTVVAFVVIGLIFNIHVGKGVFYGFIFTLSSTAIVLKILVERGEVESQFGRIAMSILIFQDIAVIPMMLVTPMLVAGGDASISDVFITLGKAVGVVIVLFVAARFIVPKILHRVAKTRSREIFLFSIIVICMIVAVITNKAGLSLALGAFLAGMVVSETGYGYQALGNVVPFKDVFTGFFFVSVGMLINIEVFLSSPILIVLLAVGVIIVKLVVIAITINILGYPLQTAIKTGLSLAQVGEFSFILAATGTSIGLLSAEEQSKFISVSVLTMIATPFLIQYSDKIAKLFAKLPMPESMRNGYVKELTNKSKPVKDHLIIVGYGLAGRNLAKASENANIAYNIIEMNPITVRTEQAKGVPIFYGDASQEEILEHANLKDARAIVITGADHLTSKNIVETVHRLNPSLAIILRSRFLPFAKDLKALGATEVIVEEIESSVAILSKVLKKYYISDENIEAVEDEIRQNDPTGGLIRKKSQKSQNLQNIKGVEVETITIPVDSDLAGKTLRDIDVRYRYNINIVAINSGGTLKVSPGANEQLSIRDELLVTGRKNDIGIFAGMINKSKNETE